MAECRYTDPYRSCNAPGTCDRPHLRGQTPEEIIRDDVASQSAVELRTRFHQITIAFWIVKIMSTTVGETAADFLSTTLHLGLSLTSIVMAVLLVVALAVQIRLPRYVPAAYWTSVVLISIVGTLISDNLVTTSASRLT